MMTRPLSSLLLAAILLVAGGAAAAADPTDGGSTPVPGRLRVFEDWAVGCDNRLDCMAVALKPDDDAPPFTVLLGLGREGGPGGLARLELLGGATLRGRFDLVVDGKAVDAIEAREGAARASAEQAFRLIRLLGSSYALEIRIGADPLEAPSLNGLALALRYIDEQQGRVGSAAALAAIGDGPADLALPLPAPVSIVMPSPPRAPAELVGLNPAERAAARRVAACPARMRADPPVVPHALDSTRTLILLPCSAGGENVGAVPLIALGRPGAWQFSVARFDYLPGYSGVPGAPPLILNGKWNARLAELTSQTRGRPRGDCGTSETWRWDGAIFRLTEARAMPVCRGAWAWPALWRADATTIVSAAAPSP
jgi:hypothetical protein